MRKIISKVKKDTASVQSAPTYAPTFDISENFSANMSDRRMGESVRVIINFEIVERTKSYTILRIHYLFPTKMTRVY